MPNYPAVAIGRAPAHAPRRARLFLLLPRCFFSALSTLFIATLLWLPLQVRAAVSAAPESAQATSAEPDLLQPESGLTLADALTQLLRNNPQLKLADLTLSDANLALTQASMAPAKTLSLTLDNLTGSADLQNGRQLEAGLTLSSVLERGDRQSQRQALARSVYAQAEVQRRANALAEIAALSDLFIRALTRQQQTELAANALESARAVVADVTARVTQGAAPAAEQWRAEAALLQAEVDLSQWQSERDVLRQQLARYLNPNKNPEAAAMTPLRGDLFRLATLPDYTQTLQALRNSPDHQLLALQAQQQQAQSALTRSQSATDLQWQLGLTWGNERNSTALNAGLSVPLFSGERNRAALQQALNNETRAGLEQQLGEREREQVFFAVWSERQQAAAALSRYQQSLIPLLTRAVRDTRNAYLRGRYGYSEWASAQQALLQAQFQAIDSAARAQLAHTRLEQMSGLALTDDNRHASDQPLTFTQDH
ncbi:TolC family protein [Thalassolituus sp. LLYu03]|uniref:TolC family protein n=1 Tax=Thalassolituus sp. LLYu03 TaxID=3421656 RepID=UPI003D28D9BF